MYLHGPSLQRPKFAQGHALLPYATKDIFSLLIWTFLVMLAEDGQFAWTYDKCRHFRNGQGRTCEEVWWDCLFMLQSVVAGQASHFRPSWGRSFAWIIAHTPAGHVVFLYCVKLCAKWSMINGYYCIYIYIYLSLSLQMHTYTHTDIYIYIYTYTILVASSGTATFLLVLLCTFYAFAVLSGTEWR